MLWLDLSVAWRALSRHRLRTLLTMISIFVGAFSMVLASSLAHAGLVSLMSSVEELGGARLLLVAPKPPERMADKRASARAGFDDADRDRIVHDTPHIASHTLFASLGKRDVISDAGKRARTDLVAADAGIFRAFRLRVAEGRALDESDEATAAKSCVVGPELAAAAWQGRALGRWLTAGSIRCRVVGVLADNRRWGMSFGFHWNHLVVVPHRTALAREPDVRSESAIALVTDASAHNDVVKRVVNARLLERRAGVDDFELYDLGRLVERFDQTFSLLKLLIGAVAAIALGVGGVGVMNMMLVSVTERVREIGIRKALGASPRALARQFLVEAALLSGGGGGLGTLAGALLAIALGIAIRSALPGWVITISLPSVFVAMGASLAIGIGFGWLPAARAARLDPVEAMRR